VGYVVATKGCEMWMGGRLKAENFQGAFIISQFTQHDLDDLTVNFPPT
jgi:hypothetical protein